MRLCFWIEARWFDDALASYFKSMDVSWVTCHVWRDALTTTESRTSIMTQIRAKLDRILTGLNRPSNPCFPYRVVGFNWTGSWQNYPFLFCIESAVIELEVRKTFRLNRRVLSLALVCIPQDRELKPATFAGLLKNKAYRKVMISYFRYFMTEVRGTALRVWMWEGNYFFLWRSIGRSSNSRKITFDMTSAEFVAEQCNLAAPTGYRSEAAIWRDGPLLAATKLRFIYPL